jgi:hypothetical protein
MVKQQRYFNLYVHLRPGTLKSEVEGCEVESISTEVGWNQWNVWFQFPNGYTLSLVTQGHRNNGIGGIYGDFNPFSPTRGNFRNDEIPDSLIGLGSNSDTVEYGIWKGERGKIFSIREGERFDDVGSHLPVGELPPLVRLVASYNS